MTKVRVWLSHDGYRDPDDNLAQLVGAAEARQTAKSDGRVSIGAVVFGDTTDGGQYRILHPTGPLPARFAGDPRLSDFAKNKVAAGNYDFYLNYGQKALKSLGPGWEQFDLLKADGSGQHSWNFSGTSLAALTPASRNLVADIKAAIAAGGGNSNPNKVVVYSAGGGAHVPGEALAYLLKHGYSSSEIKGHFAVVQHGRSNFMLNQEGPARDLTRPYTIAISKQDLDTYKNGMDGPGLGRMVRGGEWLDGQKFGFAVAKALAVAQGRAVFQDLGQNATFKSTIDGSDAGSHAFSVDVGSLMHAWGNRMRPGEILPTAKGTEHLIKHGGDYRLRVIYDEFDWKDAVRLMNGGSKASVAAEAVSDDAPSAAPVAAVKVSDDGGIGVEATEPFATSGKALSLGGADLFAFDTKGAPAALVTVGGKTGVGALGDANTVDNDGAGSEKIGIDPGGLIDKITLRLAELSTKDGLREKAVLVTYDEDGDVLDHHVIVGNGATTVDVDDATRYAVLSAADLSDDAHGTGHSDFALASIHFDYI